MRDHELVERGAGGHQDRRRRIRAPPGPTCLLPQRGDRARVAGQHGDVEVPDVDAELQRVGRHHAERLARAQPPLDGAAPVRQVAAAIAAHDPGVAGGAIGHTLLDRRQQDFRRQPALREDDRRHLGPEQADGELGRLAEVGRPDPQLGIDDGRVVAHEGLVAGRRPALGDLLDRLAGDATGQLAGVGDGRRGHDELGRRSVVRTDALEPAQDVGEVRAEDAAIGVQLVDDDVAQVLEQRRPLRVVGQDPRVEHVGVRQHQVGPGPHRAAGVLRRVAVVGEHAHLGHRLRQRLQLRELVLGQRLGREQIEDAGFRTLDERLQDRQVVAERLARRRRRDHHDVAAGLDQLPHARLVAEQLLDAARAQGLGDARVERRGKRRQHGGARGEVTGGGDAAPGRGGDQQIVQDLAEHRGDCIMKA